MIKKITKLKLILQISISTIVTALAVIGIVNAATTIGTNINTGGTLTVSGANTFNGNSTFGDAAGDVNLFTGTLQASTTALFTNGLTAYGNSTFGDAAADVNLFTGTLQASTTALFTNGLLTYGNSTFGDGAGDVNLFTGTLQASTTALFTSGLTSYGNLTVTNNGLTTLVNASSTLLSVSGTGYIGGANGLILSDGSITDTSGNISFDDETLTSTGNINFNTASSTGLTKVQTLKVSSGGSTLSGILFGTCSVDPQSITSATSTLVAASCAASGVRSEDTVFVTPPSDTISNDNWLVFEGASASTTAGYIEITLFNASTTAAIDGSARTWKWMSIR